MRNLRGSMILVLFVAGWVSVLNAQPNVGPAAIDALLEQQCMHLNKERLSSMLHSRFPAKLGSTIDPDLLKIMEGVIKRTDFDDVSEEKSVEIIALVYEAYKKGAPLEYLDQIFDVAYQKTISVDNLAAAAKALKEFHHSDVPQDIAEEFVYHSLENGWDPEALPVLSRGLIYGVERGLTAQKVALIIMLDVEQGRLAKAGASQVVLDAIKLVREKEPGNWKPLRQSEQALAQKQEEKRKLERLRLQAEERKSQKEIEKKKSEEDLKRSGIDQDSSRRAEQERVARQIQDALRAYQEEIARYQRQQSDIDAGLARSYEELDRERQKRDRERQEQRQRQAVESARNVTAYGKSGRLDVMKLYAAVDRYLGIPYRYGGDSDLGIDCSAFTRRVYRSNNIELPRTSREQSFVGLAVGLQIMQPGDLVFFDTSIAGTISHVGIYLGSGTFAHASSSKGVTKSSIRERYYTKRFVKANRIFEM